MRLRTVLILLGLVVGVAFLVLRGAGSGVEPGSVLVLDVEGAYVESADPPLLARLLGESERPFVSLLSEIAKASRDDRIDTIVFRIRSLQIGWAKAQEIRAAIERAEELGRRTIAYLEVESFGANLEYYVASAAREIYVAPGARAPVVGLAAEYLFLGGMWESLGLEIEVERIGRYKTAVDTFTGDHMSDDHREMAESLLGSIDAQFVQDIAAGRELEVAAIRRAIDAAPVTPSEMRAHGLIDGVSFFDELLEDTLGDPPLLTSASYAAVDPSEVGFEPVAHVALVYGTGSVVTGRGDRTPTGSPVMASETLSEAIVAAARDDDVDAILFRIDSPGGSPLASDIVWRAIQSARAEGKPVVASFSDVAASGGYYVACGADAIVASPASITGSIGVFVLRPVLGGVFEKLDIGFETLTRGAHADLGLSMRRLSPGSSERLRAEVSSIYQQFVERVAEGRSLAPARVDALGQGRVWTGAQAAEVGLVDELGGLRVAVLRVKRELGLDPDADVSLVAYPPPKSLVEQVSEAMRRVSLRWVGVSPLHALARRLEPWLLAASDGAPALVMPFPIEIH